MTWPGYGRLRSYEDFVRFCINHQPTVCDFGAFILFMRRIWTDDNTGWIMSISFAGGISSSLYRIFFLSLCFADGLSFNRRLFLPFTRYTAYARVRALRIDGYAGHKQRDYDCRDDFQRFRFHGLSFVTISQPVSQTDVRGGKFKKDLRSCVAIRPAFSTLLSRYSFSKTRNLSSSI